MARNSRPKRPQRPGSPVPMTMYKKKQLNVLQRQFAKRRMRKTQVTDVISMRGRRHVMEAPAPDQPQSAQDLFAESRSIDAFSYDAQKRILEITFVSGGVYWFYGVPYVVYGAFKTAGSKGRFFHDHIYGYWSGPKGNKKYHPKYNYRKVK